MSFEHPTFQTINYYFHDSYRIHPTFGDLNLTFQCKFCSEKRRPQDGIMTAKPILDYDACGGHILRREAAAGHSPVCGPPPSI